MNLSNALTRFCISTLCLVLLLSAEGPALGGDQAAFFESRIRPILSQECYECHHSGGQSKGGLTLNTEEGRLLGGDSGPLWVIGHPEQSLLIKVLRHQIEDLKMPRSAPKLEASVIADFELWIREGAFDPGDLESERDSSGQWPEVFERRRQWWSFQPVEKGALDDGGEHAEDRIDWFLDRRLESTGLSPAPRASREVLIRRLSFALRGLPPSLEEVERFVSDDREEAFEFLVDAFLASPQFGERWARHWMDWVRYADSHGSEGDPMIPNAWVYRDYLIRALNEDVPYNQMVVEHLAGDLLENPRLHAEEAWNESAIGTAHLRMVFHGFAPTDALAERVRFTDDQIDVVSKAFMGLTVSCARCHNHKFDPISQEDYYSMYGIFTSGRPAIRRVDVPGDDDRQIRRELKAIKKDLRLALVGLWAKDLEKWQDFDSLKQSVAFRTAMDSVDSNHVLWPLKLYSQSEIEDREGKQRAWLNQFKESLAGTSLDGVRRVGLAEMERDWFWNDAGRPTAAEAGSLVVSDEDLKIIERILPAGIYSHRISKLDPGVLHSNDVDLEERLDLWILVAGDGGAASRYVVQNYPRNGTVYPVTGLNGGRWRWQRYPLRYWEGDSIHIEVTTAADQPILARLGNLRSWIGVREAVFVPSDSQWRPSVFDAAWRSLLIDKNGSLSEEEVLVAIRKNIERAIDNWAQGQCGDGDALWLDGLLNVGLLNNGEADRAASKALMLAKRYRKLDSRLKPPLRVPSVIDAEPRDHVLFERGNHQKPAQVVRRQFLEALGARDYPEKVSGRLELARDIVSEENPLTGRVVVNRLWHHLFGQGLVSTVDNLGRMGEKPSHPELLDWLVHRFYQDGWSMKKMIRLIVSSEAWQRSNRVPLGAVEKDPSNRLLSYRSPRRLEAEAIRDSILKASGTLDLSRLYGPAETNGSARRSVYQRIKRNSMNAFLAVFDQPTPASSVGRRDETNVPAQSLTLLNDPFVLNCAKAWDERFEGSDLSSSARIDRMYQEALGRSPNEVELKTWSAFLTQRVSEQAEHRLAKEAATRALSKAEERWHSLVEQGKASVLESRGRENQPLEKDLPQAFSVWTFEDNAGDEYGRHDLDLRGGARIEGGALVLEGNGAYACSKRLDRNLGEKTFEAWLMLSDLDQRGGGVVSVQTLDGGQFDALVYAERQGRRWIAGSNHFARTQDVGGESEEKGELIVHLAVTYHKDGKITLYRNGRPYGRSYKVDSPLTLTKGESEVLLGNRHGGPSESRLFKGRILEARLYDYALSPEAVLASEEAFDGGVSIASAIAALSASERQEAMRIKLKIEALKEELEHLDSKASALSPWAHVAHGLFNLKEFIYLP